MTRRGFLISAAGVGAAGVGGVAAWHHFSAPPQIAPEPLALSAAGKLLDTDYADPFVGGRILADLPFEYEVQSKAFERKLMSGHDARQLIDLASFLTPEGRITPADRFYIRTECPDELQATGEWMIKIHGEVKNPQDVPLRTLLPAVAPQGRVLLECSGNARPFAYGLLSLGEWAGIPIQKVIELAQPTAAAKAILVSGFDQDKGPSKNDDSPPSCGWVFPIEQLVDAHAFLATQLNGAPLAKDHGAPVRLVIPGWYGCAGVKWVNEIQFVDRDVPATPQMREYASRTMQRTRPSFDSDQPEGPELAREYRPAVIDQAAIPVRVEKWNLAGTMSLRVLGITWGGKKHVDKLEIRFRKHRLSQFNPVDFCTWKTTVPEIGVWCHLWQPSHRGLHWIELRIPAGTRARKMRVQEQDPTDRDLNVGYYDRAVKL